MFQRNGTHSRIFETALYALLTVFCLTAGVAAGPAAAQAESQKTEPPSEPEVENTKAALPETAKTTSSDVASEPKNGSAQAPAPAQDAALQSSTDHTMSQEVQAQEEPSGKRKKKKRRKADIGHDHSDKSEPLVPTTTLPPGTTELHKLQFRLSGSMCYSCLMTLKKKLKGVDGVALVKIDRPVHNVYQPYAPDLSSWAEAIVIYDLGKVAVPDLRTFMRTNGYHTYKVVDKLLDKPLESFKEEEKP